MHLGAHKIGAAMSGPRMYGRKFYGHHAFSDLMAVGRHIDRIPRELLLGTIPHTNFAY